MTTLPMPLEAIPVMKMLPVGKIDEDPAFQVRLHWDPRTDRGLEALAASLAGPEGLIHPVIVVPLAQPTTFGRTYALIAGHRRLAAARRLGWRTIPARVLPACDLTAPLARLHLLAIAVRENTEREDLPPADRRAALRQLEALYAAVYPATTARQRPQGVDAEAPAPFPRWAAKVTQVSERTIRRDLRAVLLTGGVTTVTSAGASVAPPSPSASEALSSPVARIVEAAHQAMTVLQSLDSTVPLEDPLALPDTQRLAIHQTLQTLQAALTAAWPAVRGSGAAVPSLLAVALAAEEHVVALCNTLRVLRNAPLEAWVPLSPVVAQRLSTAMTTLLADWHALAPRVQVQLPGAPAADAPAPSPPCSTWGRSVALA